VYCGGINVKNQTITLAQGNYILVGGGLTTQNTNATLVGDKVMIYNTFGHTTNHGDFDYSPIQLNANSHVSLKAPTSGTYAGILIFEDRNAPAGTQDDYGGGSTAVYEGTIYAKNATVKMYGNSSISSKYTIVVADKINLVGTTTFNNDYSLLPTGSPVQRIVLVE
jgi:hypothetical protein